MNMLRNTRASVIWMTGCGLAFSVIASGCGNNAISPLPPVDSGGMTDDFGDMTDPIDDSVDDDSVADETLDELPGLTLSDGGILIDGVEIVGDPEQFGADLATAPVSAGDEDLSGSGATARSVVQATGMRVTANPVNVNTSVTFTATIQGGTGLYYFFWWLEGDTKWTQGSRSYTRTLTKTPKQSMYFVAIDTNRVQSDLRSWYVTVNAAAPTAITGAIGASQTTDIRPGTDVTFTAVNVQGGVPPYTYYWMLDNDAKWSTGGVSFTRQIDDSAPKRTIYLVVYDSTGRYSDFISLGVTVSEPPPSPVERVCPSIAGTWSLSNTLRDGTLRLQVNGSTVTGTYKDGCGIITGQVVAGGSDCPDCVVVQGTWDETNPRLQGGIPTCDIPEAPYGRGEIRMTFNPELSRFDSRWSLDGASHWQGDLWSGSRASCN